MYKNTIRFFGKIGIKYLPKYVSPLKGLMVKSNLGILFETYVGKMLFFSFLSALVIFIGINIIFLYQGLGFFISLTTGFIASVIIFIIVLTLFHGYPLQLIMSKKGNIEASMPFAINHMAAIASAGVPPFIIFKLISEVDEYGEIKNECRRIVRNVEVFGMDLTTALKNVAKRSSSNQFREFIYGIVNNIETGGDIKKYFESSAKEALFEYRLIREKYAQTLSTYADFYTAVLIAAPLFFVSILSVMALIGGEIFGLSIPLAMRLGIYVLIPIVNIIFLLFIHITQPRM